MDASLALSSTQPGHIPTRPGKRREAQTADLLRLLGRARGRARERVLQRIVEANMPVARMLARRYAGRGLSVADLEQIAYLGLTSAAHRFDPSQGDFLAYAVPTIKGELRKAFRDLGWTVRPPRRLQELQARVWQAEAELTQTLGRSPRPTELAAHLGVEVEEVIEVLAIDGCFAPSSLDLPVSDEDSTTYADHQGAPDPGFDRCEARAVLGPAVRSLTGRDRKIVELRFFHGWTQQQIGDEIGVTQMQVSRLLTRILSDLRHVIGGRAA